LPTNERERIRERIVEVKQDMAARGRIAVASGRFGYDIVPEGKLRRLVPNEAEQRVRAAGYCSDARGAGTRRQSSDDRESVW